MTLEGKRSKIDCVHLIAHREVVCSSLWGGFHLDESSYVCEVRASGASWLNGRKE